MSKFEKSKFDIGSGSEVWVYYHPNGIGVTKWEDRIFVGRFKYANKKTSANHLIKFLIANVSVEEWKALQDNHCFDETRRKQSATLLEDRGYLSYNIVKRMKELGFTKYSELRAYNRACSDVNHKAYQENRVARQWDYPSPSQFVGQ